MKFCRCKRDSAFTLLEVVVGLTLMASVLVGSLLAFSAHQKQRRHAEAKLAAVSLADQMLHQFTASRDGIPALGRGPIPGKPTWFWRTSVVGTQAPAEVLLKVIRLEIIELTDEGSQRPLVTVDVVEPIDP